MAPILRNSWLLRFSALTLAAAMLQDHAAAQSDDSSTAITAVTKTSQTEAKINRTLESFKKIDEHPLFEMKFYGDYDADTPLLSHMDNGTNASGWACSLFVSFGKDGSAMYGRNFDWQNNPALLLHTHPSDGYASVSMVDISYLGFTRKDEKFKTVQGRKALLSAPMLPFDGMNEHGLTVGMAAVGNTDVPVDPDKPTVGSLQIIRLMLDQTKTVDEALTLLLNYNIKSRGGPQIHYLIADAKGQSALVELKDGQTHIMRGDGSWQSATNFYLTGQKSPLKQCPRFAKINRSMQDNQGSLTKLQSMMLLKNVAQKTTRWSTVFDMKARTATISMSRNYGKRYEFSVQDLRSATPKQ